jgi:hypothetical protein
MGVLGFGRVGDAHGTMRKRQHTIWIVGVLVGLLCLSALAYSWVAAGSFRVCTPQDAEDSFVKTIAALDSIVDLSIKLSTTLVGLGAALLIGLKSGLRLTFPIKVIVIIATLLLIQSALYAVWWRFGVAELWLNQCLELVDEARLDRRYQAHFYFFLAGLVSLGVLVIGAMFSEQTSGDDK